jgi:hypothetical protein
VNSPTPIPGGSQQHYSEASSLRSFRDSDATQRQWRKSDAVSRQHVGLARSVEQLQRDLNRLRRGFSADESFVFPFRIVPGTTWTDVQVELGYVKNTDGLFELGGDGADIALTPGIDSCWVYVDLSTNPPTIQASATEPDANVDKVPLGWIDTSDEDNEIAEITQFWFNNIYVPC